MSSIWFSALPSTAASPSLDLAADARARVRVIRRWLGDCEREVRTEREAQVVGRAQVRRIRHGNEKGAVGQPPDRERSKRRASAWRSLTTSWSEPRPRAGRGAAEVVLPGERGGDRTLVGVPRYRRDLRRAAGRISLIASAVSSCSASITPASSKSARGTQFRLSASPVTSPEAVSGRGEIHGRLSEHRPRTPHSHPPFGVLRLCRRRRPHGRCPRVTRPREACLDRAGSPAAP